jgi:hypothetical protein
MRPVKVNLDKLAVAERQIDTAIWLWFNDGDVVSIVTLSGAALGVLDSLLHHKSRKRAFPFMKELADRAGLKPKDALNLIKADEVFAKHARTDPTKTREYYFARASCYLLCAVASYYELMRKHGEEGTLRGLFSFRYGMMNEETLYKTPPRARQTPEERAEVDRLKSLSRREFFLDRGGDFVGFAPMPDSWPDDRNST